MDIHLYNLWHTLQASGWKKKENEKINWENGKIGDMANTEIRGNVLEKNDEVNRTKEQKLDREKRVIDDRFWINIQSNGWDWENPKIDDGTKIK